MGKRLFFAALLLLSAIGAHACTAAVISGNATADGRPLLWKTRDTDNLQNAMKYFKGSKYDFIGLVDCNARSEEEVWMGTNSAGFSIMNTQSFNLEKTVNGVEPGDKNGNLMFRALQVCATVDEFRHFMDTTRLEGLCANFGVIDAKGGAGWCETSTRSYRFFDANDPLTAPDGYIARTNFSITGTLHEGLGYVRYQQADAMLKVAAAQRSITPQWLLGSLARSFANPQTGIDLADGTHNRPATNGWFIDHDLINRSGTACTSAIQGVRPTENPELTTMWLILGYPPVSTAFPFWLKDAAGQLPAIYTAEAGAATTVFGKKVDKLKERVYAFHEGIGSDRYFNWEALHNLQGNGIMQQLSPVEKEIFRRTETARARWYRQGQIPSKELARLYADLSSYVIERYQQLFGL
ncbi:MAG: hypothetical protein MSD82_05750 [Prevotella sp.]|nr:hypothetical protein [Prevotella sp.]